MLARLVSLLAVFMSLGQATLDQYVHQTNLGGILYLVNRDFTLARAYQPPDLVAVQVPSKGGEQKLRQEAATALEGMFGAAKEEDMHLVAISGYRSYGQQRAIWRRKLHSVRKVELAQLYVAPPGASEHQLGLAMDVAVKGSSSLTARFGDTKEGKWVAQHAHEHGFIIRYLDEWTDITGYAYEPWHLRYVGSEHAQRIHQLGVALEDYVAQLKQAAFGDYVGETNH